MYAAKPENINKNWDRTGQNTDNNSASKTSLRIDTVHWGIITKIYLYNFDFLKPHFYNELKRPAEQVATRAVGGKA